MLLHLPGVLPAEAWQAVRASLQGAAWQDGRISAGPQAALAKRNQQLSAQADNAAEYAALAQQIASALQQHPLFIAAALPSRILTPLFNRYAKGEYYANHVDAALQFDPASGSYLRADISTTIFLSEPDEYDGGELVIEDAFGVHEVKLAAGDAILYPASSLHRVQAISRGQRFAAFLWTQSLIRDAQQRRLLYELDLQIQQLRQRIGDVPEVLGLTSHYHNLLRLWAQT